MDGEGTPSPGLRLRGLRAEGRCQEAGAAAVTGGWGAVAVAVLAVVKRLGGDGALTEVIPEEVTTPPPPFRVWR